MSRVQESIQKNERQLILDRQSLAHMENSSWRHMDDLHCALEDQEPSHFKRTIRRLKAGIDKLEESNVILRRLNYVPKRHIGVKHPRDPAQLAKLIVDIATGEVDDRERTPEDRGVDPAASAMGRKGGKARAANISAEERSRIAKNAARLRWAATSGGGT